MRRRRCLVLSMRRIADTVISYVGFMSRKKTTNLLILTLPYLIAAIAVVFALVVVVNSSHITENLVSENVMEHAHMANSTVTWVNILNGRAKITKLDEYTDIVSAAPSVNGDGVPVITLLSRNGHQNHLLLNYLNSLKAQ